MAKRKQPGEVLLDVRGAAAHVGRHPETVRRWVWSGRLAARRRGNRLLVERSELEAVAQPPWAVLGLDAWVQRAQRARDREVERGSGRSAADLVLEDRAGR